MNAMSTNTSRLHDMNDPSQETDFADLRTREEFFSEGEDLTLKGESFSAEGENLTLRNKELNEPQTQEVIADKTKLGIYLRQTREQQGLSLQQVADKLFLNTHFVRAIENDDYNNLPSAVFVRGYLRNYAKLLGLSAEEIIEAYEAIGQGRTPALSPQLRKQKNQVNTGDSRFKALTAIIIIALMVLVTLWNIYPDSSSNRDGITVQQEELPLEAGDAPLTFIPPTEGDKEVEDSVSAVKGVVQDAGQLVVHFKKQAQLKITDGKNNKLYEGTGEANKELPIVGNPPFSIKASNTDVAIEYQGKIVNLVDHDKKQGDLYIFGEAEPTVTESVEKNAPLIIHFKRESWLGITDSNNKALYNGTKKGGEKLTVNGMPPFKIKAGNPASIDVEYGSTTVNLTNHTEKEGKFFIFGK